MFEPGRATHLIDLVSAGRHNYLLGNIRMIEWLTPSAPGVEHRLFPGFVALVLGSLGIACTVRVLRRHAGPTARAWQLVFVGLAGLVFFVLSFGDWFEIAGRRIPLPFAFFRHHIPGFAGVRALSRFVLPAQLALALFAAVGAQALFRRIPRRSWLVTTVCIALVVAAESAVPMQFARLPTVRDDGGVEQALQRSPQGVVLELPVSYVTPAWIYNEPSQMLLAMHDHDPRVNGYSGFYPPGFAASVNALRRFPSHAALAQARAVGVRYVILRTRLIGDIEPVSVRLRLEVNGVGLYTDETARRLISEMPPGTAARVDKLAGGYLIELR